MSELYLPPQEIQVIPSSAIEKDILASMDDLQGTLNIFVMTCRRFHQ